MAVPTGFDMTTRSEPVRRPVWLLVLLAVGILIGIANFGAFLYGLTLPDDWKVEESVVVDATPDEIYPLLATPKRWQEWTTWSSAQDPTVELRYAGPESGQDASFAFRGESIGQGSVTITEAEPATSIRYRLVLQGSEFSPNGRILLEPTDAGTKVTRTDGGSLGGTLGRLFRERLETSVAADFRDSLDRLKRTVEETGTPKDADTK